MNTHKLLQALEHQLAQLAREIEPQADRPAASSRFDRQLFFCRGTRLRDYFNEIAHNVQAIRQLVADRRSERVAFMSERLIAQIGALQRELSTQALRRQDAAPPSSPPDLYHKLAEHQDYERRLNTMIQDRESLLAQSATLEARQRLQKEIAALEGRLSRCRHALLRLERLVERREQGF